MGTNWDYRNNGGAGFGNPYATAHKKQRQSFDIRADLNISLEEAVLGCKKNFTIKIPGKSKADSLSLKVPAGCMSGTKMRLKGQGKQKPNGDSGDLIVAINIEPHDYFEVDEKNILINVPVTFTEAALGEKIEIPTPDGKKIRIKIPAGTKCGAKLTIKGAGLKPSNKTPGNLIVKINIEVPKKLDKKQEKALKDYAKVENKEVRQW